MEDTLTINKIVELESMLDAALDRYQKRVAHTANQMKDSSNEELNKVFNQFLAEYYQETNKIENALKDLSQKTDKIEYDKLLQQIKGRL